MAASMLRQENPFSTGIKNHRGHVIHDGYDSSRPQPTRNANRWVTKANDPIRTGSFAAAHCEDSVCSSYATAKLLVR